jgi:flagellar secretion chaperone FliS
MSDKSGNSSKDNNMYLSVSSRAASAYNRVGLETGVQSADPHELINMLFNGLLDTLVVAKGAMERQDIAAKGKAISKAVRLLDEGLKAALSPAGGELSANLGNLYDYCIRRLTHANIHNDAEAIEEVRALIDPIADSWRTIRSAATQ